MKKKNSKLKVKTMSGLFALFALTVCIVFFMPVAVSATSEGTPYTEHYLGYSGDNKVEMFSGSNTHNYYSTEQTFSDGFRKLYNLDAKNGNSVYNEPMITVFTHGYGSDASNWSNNGSRDNKESQFAYDAASPIAKLLEKAINAHGGVNFYWARCDGNSFRLIDLNAQPTDTYYNSDPTAITLPRITYGELLYHTVIVFDASDAVKEAANDIVYDELNYMLSKIAYDIRVLTGKLPKINLIGHSRGGITNLQYALDHPQMVKSLISVGTPYLGGNMLSNDSVLEMIGFIEADPANPGKYIVPGGIQDIRNEALQAHYRNRWNFAHPLGLFSNINAHALGAYCELGFLKTIIDEGGDNFPEGFDKGGLKTIINLWLIHDVVLALAGATPAQKEIINTLEKSVEFDSFTFYVYDDIVVDLGSQLATSYLSFKQDKEEFNDISLFDKRTNWSQVPVLHNLETYSTWFTDYVNKEVSLGRNLHQHSFYYETIDKNFHRSTCDGCGTIIEEKHSLKLYGIFDGVKAFQCTKCYMIDYGKIQTWSKPEEEQIS